MISENITNNWKNKLLGIQSAGKALTNVDLFVKNFNAFEKLKSLTARSVKTDINFVILWSR